MRTWKKTVAALGMASTFSVAAPMTANAAPTATQEVVSSAGITAAVVTTPGTSAAEVDRALGEGRPSTAPAGTTATQFFCEENAVMMDWTNNEAKYCYGYFYEYRDGQQVSKVNMIQLKAADPGISGQQEARLKDWCDDNGTYCSIVFAFIPYVGKYLKGLL